MISKISDSQGNPASQSIYSGIITDLTYSVIVSVIKLSMYTVSVMKFVLLYIM